MRFRAAISAFGENKKREGACVREESPCYRMMFGDFGEAAVMNALFQARTAGISINETYNAEP